MNVLLPELDFANLKHNFNKRTWGFERYQEKLGKSNPRLLNWIGSIDYSGYVREKCLRYLVNNYQLGDENRILLRLEDWVEEVRAIAWQWTKDNFHKLSLEQINKNYQLILYLARKERLQIFEGVKIINFCLIEKLNYIDNKQFQALNSNFRKYLYLLTLLQNQTLRPCLIKDKDPNNRLLLLKLFKPHQLTQLEINALKQDKCALIKKHFIYYRLENKIEPSQTELMNLILDQNKGVREIAAYYLSKYYEVDAYQIYKQRSDKKFYYIADFARSQDLEYFLLGMNSEDKQIRFLCLKALCNLNLEYVKQFDLKQLITENNKFRQLISTHVLPILSLAELQEYENYFLSQTKKTWLYLSLLYKKSYWHFLNLALDLILVRPTQENISSFQKIFSQKTEIYQMISNDLKIVIVNQINSLEKIDDNRLQKLCQDLEFILKNA